MKITVNQEYECTRYINAINRAVKLMLERATSQTNVVSSYKNLSGDVNNLVQLVTELETAEVKENE